MRQRLVLDWEPLIEAYIPITKTNPRKQLRVYSISYRGISFRYTNHKVALTTAIDRRMLHWFGPAICWSAVDAAITWRCGTRRSLQFHNGCHRWRCRHVGYRTHNILLRRPDTGCDLGDLETRGRTPPRTAYRFLLDLHQAAIWPLRNGITTSACTQSKEIVV
jgi:hypothetical protein